VVLRAYAERHGADPEAWRFLTGPEDTLVPLIVKGFYLGVQVLPPATGQGDHPAHEAPRRLFEVMHSGKFALLDPEGRMRAYYDGDELDQERVERDIRQLLR
jgi:protein SCO1